MRTHLIPLLSAALLAACGGGDSATPPVLVSLEITGDAVRDGWATNVIVAAYPTSPFIQVGDDGGDQELRGFVSFLITGIPAGAVVTDAIILLKRAIGPAGTPPEIRVDHVLLGADLDASDFGAASLADDVGVLTNTTTDQFTVSIVAQLQDDVVNGRTYSEFRLRSPSGTDGNAAADRELFVSTDSPLMARHPMLFVTYQMP